MIDVSSVILELMNLGTVHAEAPQVNPSQFIPTKIPRSEILSALIRLMDGWADVCVFPFPLFQSAGVHR
jgi:hypothetical protein